MQDMDMQDTDIRHAQVEDFDQWSELWRGYLAFYGEPEDTQTSQITWQRFIDEQEPMHAFVAVRNGQVVGFAHLIGHRSTWSPKDRLYLNDLFVAQAHRQNGVARQLLEHARHFFDDAAVQIQHAQVEAVEHAGRSPLQVHAHVAGVDLDAHALAGRA